MLIALHKQARTTPHVRAQIAASDEPVAVLARRFGVTEPTIYKWKRRPDVYDRPHTAHRLQTTLTPGQEAIVVYLRRALLLPLDDLLAVTREFLCPDVSRSGLDRCLRRHGVGNLRALRPAPDKAVSKTFKTYVPGFVHVDVKYLPQMADEDRRRFLFVAIDRATRWVYVALKADKSARSARAFLSALATACPVRITRLLTDNGTEFTDRLFGSRARAPTGTHEFDRLCQELGIEHRLTPPRHPQTNGMVERFNGRIADLLRTHHFRSSEDLEQTLHRYVTLYNHHLPQKALNAQTPAQALQHWYASKPELFHRRPNNRPGRDRYVPPS
ncbi:IS481 family transposase [Immundisolibacter cernigliae]|uniref:Transposase n=2 Tax=Immundisolibacter cernigliae TaxID=1810504 RepID=A0A1B1YRN1_9GAMM|nr:IS481 family transposase [Immundisolibacter cernigliae]ANX03372.1 transposase [Immundisolibacter cernigliae]